MHRRVFAMAHSSLIAFVVVGVAACGPKPPPQLGGGPVGPEGGPAVSGQTRAGFQEAVARFMEIRRSGRSWTQEQCRSVADAFEQVSEDAGGLAEAIYNRGVAFQQCGMHDEAKAAFAQALQINQNYPQAMTQLGVYEMLANNMGKAEEYFTRVTRDFGLETSAHEAYVNLGILAALRGDFYPGQTRPSGSAQTADLQIGNALSLRSDSVAALENLARFYFDYSTRSEANARFRRFAQLICAYAISKNNQYAPIYNLRGLIYLREENIRAAINDFRRAAELDPDFYEAHMNYASLNLGFRGYQQAFDAYTEALRIRPDSYDAMIGLGVAIRGLASEEEAAELADEYGAVSAGARRLTYEMAMEKYEAAKRLDEERPEAYVNIALLHRGFVNSGECPDWDRAVASFETAVQRATAFRGNSDSGVDYAALRDLAQTMLERTRKDRDVCYQMVEAERQAAEVERQMQEAERALQELERALQGAEGAAQPEGGEAPPPVGEEAP